MSQRERFLSLVIGGLFVAILFQWAFSQYRSAIRLRQNRLNALVGESDNLQAQWLAGAEAERQLGEYKVRSLSSDTEVAKSSYQSWLLETVRRVGVVDAIVAPLGDVPVGDLYTRFGFRVSGRIDLPGLVDLIYAIQARDQLHRIRELQFAPARASIRRSAEGREDEGPDQLTVVLAIDAISMSLADAVPPPPSETPSWRITHPLAESRQTILNRNFFQPPNQPPQYEGESQLVAYQGQENVLQFPFRDPENQNIQLQLEGELPPWAQWDAASGRLRVTPPAASPQPSESAETDVSDEAEASDEPNTGEAIDEPTDESPAEVLTQFDLRVIATDDGYPPRQTVAAVVVKTQAPPPPPPPSTPPPGFDDATQTFLTALVQGRDDWTAWMNVRTRGKTLKLKVGDEFEIGSIHGKVTEVSARRVKLEIDGQSYELRPAGKLSDVLK